MMSKILHFVFIFLFSLIVISCSSDEGSSTTTSTLDNTSTTDNTSSDTTAPVLVEVTAVKTPSNDNTPNYTFSSNEVGTITYSGSCTSGITSATNGNNTITFNGLNDGTYSTCTIVVTDLTGNVSNTLTITSFVVDTAAPIMSEVTAVTTPSNDTTPDYTFSSSETGTITYGGSCSSSTTSASSGNNSITLTTLGEGTYAYCTISVKDSAGNGSNALTISSFIIDSTAAALVEVSAVTTPTNDTTPDYTFSSSETGTITYGGSCSSSTTSATTDNNTITLVSLSDGTYSDCTITVTDNASNGVTLNISSFIIDTIAPTVSSIAPTDNQSEISITSNVLVTFSESMDNISVKTNTSNTTCSGSLELSSDNFSSCVQMSSSPTNSNSGKTFSVESTDNLSYSTTYKIRVTTEAKDSAGNTLVSEHETPSGFTTIPFWSGTIQLGSSSNDGGRSSTVDSSNNIYVTGYTNGGLDGNSNSGNYDIFIAKYYDNGTKHWINQLGSSYAEMGNGIAVDTLDNIYVTGYTQGGLDDNTSSSPNSDLFLIKYNSSGGIQWTKQMRTSSGEMGKAITIDSSDNIYVTGLTSGALDNNSQSGNVFDHDFFLVKYNSNGTKQWTQQLGSSENDFGRGVAVDSYNNLYVTGETFGDLDNNTNSGSGCTYPPCSDIFLVKYNSSGTKQWTKQLGTSGNDSGNGVIVDSSNNIYVTGYTNGDLDNITNSGDGDIFLLKYNSSGLKQWTKLMGTSQSETGMGLTIDSSDNIYVTGYTYGSLNYNSYSGSGDIFLVKYNSSGTLLWSKLLGTNSTDWGYGVKVNSSNNVYVTGDTEGGLDGNSNSGSADIFLVKYNSSGVRQ
jgi:hypothetical protein